MAKDYKRSIYNRYSTRLSNRFSHETMAKAHPKNLSCRQKHNFNAMNKGGYIASTIQSRGLLQSPILSSEKRRLVPPCNRLKSAQQIYNKRTLSNGKSDVHKAPLISKRLHGQIRPERRLFSSGDSPTITTVPSVYLAGANLSVSMPTVRAKHGTAHFYKTTETRGGIPSHTKHQTSHLPRRHPNHRVISKTPTTTHSPSNGIATEPRFYNQLREVEAHALPSSRISGIRDKLEHNEILPTSREGSKRSKSVPISSEGESNITSPSLPTSRFSGILSPSSLGSPTPFQTLTMLSNTPSSVEQWGGGGGVSGHSPPRSPSTGGTPVVDQQHETGEWERNMPCNDRDDDHLRRLKNGVGCHIRQAVNQRALVTSGNPPPHQCLGTESYFFSRTDFPETPLECIGETPPRQHNGGCLYKQPRGHSLTQSCLIDTRSMEMVSSTQHFDICGIPSGHLECSGGQRISNLCGFERLETTTTTIIQPFLKDREIDLFASRLKLQRYVSWRPDPYAVATDAFSIDWGQLKAYAFPPFNLIPRTLMKVISDNANLLLVAPVWQAQHWWPLLLRLTVKHPVLLRSSQTLLEDPSNPRAVHPMYPRLQLAVWTISNSSVQQKAFRTQLPAFCPQPHVSPPTKPMTVHGQNGTAGVIEGKLIQFQPVSEIY